MTDYNSYPTLLQSSQSEYVGSETMDANGNQMSSNSNNNIIYNSTPLILLNSQKSDMALLQNSMINDGQTYVTIQTQSNTGATDLNGPKILNTPIIIQSSQSMPLQTSQYQQQPPTTINVQQNSTQMTSLTPSQLQSLSYLMQTQMAPQFIQTTNGLIQIIPQGFITTQQQQQSNQGQSHENSIQSQMSGLPTIGWSLGNFNGSNTPITLDNQLQQFQMNNINLPQLIPLQQVIQSGNSFFTNQPDDDQNQMVSTIVDLNANDKKSLNGTRKPSRRKRKPATKISSDSCQLSSTQLVHPTSTNEVAKEAAESSSGQINDSVTLYDNKGRPFSFLCPDCPKKFTLNSRLSAHMRCHTGMRPFTCTVCGFSFTQKSYLIRHAAVHKEERPFSCEKCQKSYKHYGSLANHRKLHRKDDNGDVVKLEQHNFDNGRSSSSISINNNGSEYTGTMIMCQEQPGEEGLEQENNVSGNMFTITSTNGGSTSALATTTMTSSSLVTGNNGYMLFDQISDPADSNNNNNNKSMNIFFQEVTPQNGDQLDGNYEEDYCGEEEEEDDEEEDCPDTDMVDLSLDDSHNLVSSNTFNSEYRQH